MKIFMNDHAIASCINNEFDRQNTQIELIASENIASRDVLRAQGSVLTNKYAEGYPGRRYYGGCEHVDVVEQLAIDRVKMLFGCDFANVQPHSGSQANQSVFLSLLTPGDTIMGMSLAAGGHLTHGTSVNLSGKWFKSVSYGVTPDTHLIDFNEVREVALREKPKLIIAGGSAYARIIDFKTFRDIADEVGAYLMVDMAHFAGLVAGGVYPSPFPHAHVVTSTTHKTLRGPRGGIVLTDDAIIAKKINSAIFPGLQGGPLMHVIAGKAVCFYEALQPSFKEYAQNVVDNARIMGSILSSRGFDIISDGTDSHLILVNTYVKGINGHEASQALEQAHMTCNKNAIPFDELPPIATSGIRLGSPAATTRGFKNHDFAALSSWIADILEAPTHTRETVIGMVKENVLDLCAKYPLDEFVG